MNLKNYLTGLLLVTVIVYMSGCGNNRNSQPKPQKTWEYRTERYLDRVATEADLSFREAQDKYREACKKQNTVDSVSAELATARGEMVKEAESNLEKAQSARMTIATYREILNTPSEEWTQEDSV